MVEIPSRKKLETLSVEGSDGSHFGTSPKLRPDIDHDIVAELLSEPVLIPQHINMLTDEIADIIANRTFCFDENQSTLVSFKPIAASLLSSA